jgi:DNA-binding NarL/FixJ family response regulator
MGPTSPDGNQLLRVLIADRDAVTRSVMRTALREDERVALVVCADEACKALALARSYLPTVLLVDTALPPDGAVELIRKVLLVSPETRILTVSLDDQEAALAALRAGAVGHLDKDIDPDELPCLVVRAANGEAIVPQQLLIRLLELLREVPDDGGWRPLHSRLTTREWEIVELLAAGASTAQMAKRLVLSQNTVYGHVKSVLRKLGLHSRRDVVAAADRLRREEASGTKTPTEIK